MNGMLFHIDMIQLHANIKIFNLKFK